MYVGIILLFIQIILKKILIRDLNKLLFLIFPTLILLFLLTFRYYPVARAIYVFLPVFVISSFIGLNQFLFFYIKKGFHKYIYFFIFVFFIISIIFPLNMEVNISNPILYVKSMKLIEKDIKKGECVFARDNDILEYYFPNIRIIKQLNSNNNDLIAVVGPCINKKNYEVKTDFFKKFISLDKNKKIFFEKISSEKHIFDLRGFVNKEISSLNIKNVENIEMDTFSQKEFFYSYRRSLLNNEQDYGRCISVILMT